MGWWDNFKTYSSELYANDSLTQGLKNIGGYSFHTVKYLFQQVSVIPSVVYSAIFHPNTQMVASHVLRITFEDLIPLVAVSYTNDMIQHHGRTYLDDEASPDLLSVNTALELGLGLVQMAAWVYKIRKQTQLAVRSTVLSIEAGKALTSVQERTPMKLCVEEQCSTLRFLKGSLRDTTAFWATEAAISLIGYIPVAGGVMSAALSIHHRGRYIMTIVLPDLCNRHQVDYLTQHSELALAAGLGHWYSTALSTRAIEYLTGIPASYYESSIRQFMMLTTISVAAHMRLPTDIPKQLRTLVDPLAGFQSFVGFCFDTMVWGLKKQVPRLLKQPSSDIPWAKIASYAGMVWDHPYAQRLEFFVIPRMLRSKKAFIQDPVIAPNWDGLRQTSIEAIISIEKIQGQLLVQVASSQAKLSAKTMWLIFGTPKSVSELLLKLMGSEAFMYQLGRIRRNLEALDPASPPEIITNSSTLEIRTEYEPKDVVENNSDELLPDAFYLNAEDIIKFKPKETISTLNANEVIRSRPLTPPTTASSLTPEDVIKKRQTTSNADAASVIRMRKRPQIKPEVEEGVVGDNLPKSMFDSADNSLF